MADLKTRGKYANKPYRCRKCGAEKTIGTNHWGACYPPCTCSFGAPAIWDCLEPVPEGYTKPEEWKIVKLGDICEIVQGVSPTGRLQRVNDPEIQQIKPKHWRE